MSGGSMDGGTTDGATVGGGTACERFDAQLEELALGHVPEPERTVLLAHSASCRACRARLDATVDLSDTLLLLAPQHEPPPGFESRVLDRWGTRHEAGERRSSRLRWLAAAAALLVLVGAASVAALVARSDPDERLAVARSGAIVGTDGTRTGSVELIGGDHPYALVVIDHPRARPGEVRCLLRAADGTDVEVGRWDYEDVRMNIWAIGIDRSLLSARLMRVVDDQGTVLASAQLD
jgi:hypothetical protein